MKKQEERMGGVGGEEEKVYKERVGRFRLLMAESEEKEMEMAEMKAMVEKKEEDEEARTRRGMAMVSGCGRLVWQECGTMAGWAKGADAGPVYLETMIQGDGTEKIIKKEPKEDEVERFGEITNWSPSKGYGLIEMEGTPIHGINTIIFHVKDMPEDTVEPTNRMTKTTVYMGRRVGFRVGPKTKNAEEWSAKEIRGADVTEEMQLDKWHGGEPGRMYGMLIDTCEPDMGAVKIYSGDVLTFSKSLFPDVRKPAVSLILRDGHGITTLSEEVDRNWYSGTIAEWKKADGYGLIYTEADQRIFFHVKYLPPAGAESDEKILSTETMDAYIGAAVIFQRRPRDNKRDWLAIQIRALDKSAATDPRAPTGLQWPAPQNDDWCCCDWAPPAELPGWSYHPLNMQVGIQPNNPYALHEWAEAPRTNGLPECFQRAFEM
jgi:hypothetical protein